MFDCPVCNRQFEAVAKLPTIGDICPRCGVRLQHKRTDKKITYLVPKDAVTQDGFTQVYIDMLNPIGGVYLDATPNPVIMRRVNGEGDMDYRVTYTSVVTNGRLICPECAGFLGTLQMLKGSFSPRKCEKFLRKEVDGRKGKCKKRTEFTFVNEVVGNVQAVR